jgi:hypothetical protein
MRKQNCRLLSKDGGIKGTKKRRSHSGGPDSLYPGVELFHQLTYRLSAWRTSMIQPDSSVHSSSYFLSLSGEAGRTIGLIPLSCTGPWDAARFAANPFLFVPFCSESAPFCVFIAAKPSAQQS